MLQNSLQKVTHFITKKCYKIHYKQLLTSSQKNVTKFITKSDWLHHKKVLQNSLQKLLASLQKSVTKFITKSYPLHYKKMLQNSLQTVTDINRCFKDSFPKWKHSPAMKIMNQWINQSMKKVTISWNDKERVFLK